MLTELQGQIERITYVNEENGYTVVQVRLPGRRDLVTAVGHLPSSNLGEMVHMKGEWTVHHRFGRQFRIDCCRTTAPATLEGIRKYLGSGLIHGIGPVMAARIVERFGEQTLEVIENEVQKLTEVEGIGAKRASRIRKAWEEQKEIRDVMLFLQSHGVSAAFAAKIFKRYGQRAIETVTRNPFRLAQDIRGIGFLTADRIAENMGFAKDSPARAEAGILHVLGRLADEGHVYCPYETLLTRCREVLEIPREVVTEAFAALAVAEKIVIEDINASAEHLRENHKAVYLSQFHHCETGIAGALRRLLQTPRGIRPIQAERAVHWVQQRLSIRLAPRQRQAVQLAALSKMMIITGGPGTGKTTIIRAILEIFRRLGAEVRLAAPTGRAAKRMSEATGFDARTVHRLLEYSLQKGGFQRNAERPLACDLLIVDEASMLDTVLAYHLLMAVPAHAALILVGDVNQLPSVGPGNVLGDILESGAVPAVHLNQIFRQAQASLIVVNAHRINQGRMPVLGAGQDPSDFFFIEREDPEQAAELIVRLATERLPRRFGFQPIQDIQVLTPMHRGGVGAEALNLRLQEALNPGSPAVVRGDRGFRINDKVMQIRNNYDKEVFNGDIGTIRRIDLENRALTVDFEGRPVPYNFSDLDELVLAYAISVHKSQGSEYAAVLLPLLTQHYPLLQRNLLYTAVTRGKRLVVIVGSRKALSLAIGNDKTQHRFTRLKERLHALTRPPPSRYYDAATEIHNSSTEH